MDSKNGKHLILDIDETLIHTFSPEDNFPSFITDLTDEQKKRVYILEFNDGQVLAGYIRPHVEYFLNTSFDEFESVAVWSAGTHYYVHSIVDRVFGLLDSPLSKPKFVMTRKHCNELKLKYDNSMCRYKPLEIIYWRDSNHNESNTIIIDDRHDICALNCMNNIRIPAFDMNHLNFETMLGDDSLKKLADWFKTDEFRKEKDVRLLKRKSPFDI